MTAPPADLLAQIDALPLAVGRPLVVSDADEVLFAFMAGFERYLEGQDLYFDWASYALHGNIRRRSDNAPVPAESIQSLIGEFFVAHTETLDPVPGAAEALAALSRRCQVVILSNVPAAQRAARQRALASHGMAYPVLANRGGKGVAVRELQRRVRAPLFFIDDIPLQHEAVRAACEEAHCVHFIADPRLSALAGPVADCHHRAATWDDIRRFIEQSLDGMDPRQADPASAAP